MADKGHSDFEIDERHDTQREQQQHGKPGQGAHRGSVERPSAQHGAGGHGERAVGAGVTLFPMLPARPRCWLLKSEPDVFSYADLVRAGREPWNGVRNYQARNFLREMRGGDLCLFYHSSARPTGVVGVRRWASRC